MEVDSMHGSIEFAKKNVAVFSPHEWENIFRSPPSTSKNVFPFVR